MVKLLADHEVAVRHVDRKRRRGSANRTHIRRQRPLQGVVAIDAAGLGDAAPDVAIR